MSNDQTTILDKPQVKGEKLLNANTASVEKQLRSLERLVYPDNITYAFTKDPELLLQYFKIREEAYAGYIGYDDFSGCYDDADAHSDIVVATDRRGEVVGGARLTVNDPLLEYYLPMEEDGFELQDIFPEYDLSSYRYGECSRLTVKPEHRDGRCYVKLCEAIYYKSKAMGLRYLFAHATPLHARKYRQMWTHYFHLVTCTKNVNVPYNPKYRTDINFCISALELD